MNNGYFSITRETEARLETLPLALQGFYMRLYARARYTGNRKGSFSTSIRDLAQEIGIDSKDCWKKLHKLSSFIEFKAGKNQYQTSTITIRDFFVPKRNAVGNRPTAKRDGVGNRPTPHPTAHPTALPVSPSTPKSPKTLIRGKKGEVPTPRGEAPHGGAQAPDTETPQSSAPRSNQVTTAATAIRQALQMLEARGAHGTRRKSPKEILAHDAAE